MTITLHTLGRGHRRDFDPATITIDWHGCTDDQSGLPDATG